MNIYLDLTKEFNENRLRAVLSSGQAVVLHRLAIMSKDGDWILREDAEALGHVLRVLARHGGRYRFGAPLDVRWLQGGWSAHFEFRHGAIRVRTDFVTRPPRLSAADLARIWREQEGRDLPFVGVRDLATLKETNREKDYAVIGELARLLTDPADQLLFSRSARDLRSLAQRFPDLVRQLAERRTVLGHVSDPLEVLEAALDAERRQLIHANEERLCKYTTAAQDWASAWPDVLRHLEGLRLEHAHEMLVKRAEAVLPFRLVEEQTDGSHPR